jgi:cold shock CspA family protein
MASGTIERFNYMKGFGYILPDAGGPHIFFYSEEANRSGRVKIN